MGFRPEWYGYVKVNGEWVKGPDTDTEDEEMKGEEDGGGKRNWKGNGWNC